MKGNMANSKNENGNKKFPAESADWPIVDSKFRLIIVAGLRAKQLLQGSTPRIEASKSRRRNTTIALEEVKRGLIHFTNSRKLDDRPVTAPGEII
jgi:DNA-directed RNA polymerase omega subunit